LTEPFAWLGPSLEELRLSGLARKLRQSASASLPEMMIDGKKVVQFSSNNYLGLATHPRVVAAAEFALKEYGVGSGASRLITGTQGPHAALEKALAEFKGAEAALVYATGSMANMGLLPCLAGEGDLILLDKADHATLYDGARLSGAKIKRFPHQDLKRLEALLAEAAAAKTGRIVVALEAVYSMDGDVAPLPEILALAKTHGAMVVVDEAHSTGVLGKTGKGILEHYSQVWHPNLAVTGTLSKALGSLGGFVAGPQKLVDWLISRSRAFIFATALPALCAAAAHEALRVIAEEPERLERLRANRKRMALGLKSRGWDIGDSASPIFPVLVGHDWKAVELQDRLLEAGYYAPAIRPPTVPAGACRLRVNVSSEHSDAQIEGFLNALGTYADRLAH
jgi:8-amino-7-oxononanoate synthase